MKALGSEGLFLFSSLDTNNDLFLSPEEFKPIAEKLTGEFLSNFRWDVGEKCFTEALKQPGQGGGGVLISCVDVVLQDVV